MITTENMKKFVSVIMPCHNGARHLDESINSVLSQTYSDWELLIIDDNSTDDSVNIIKNYSQKDSRIKFLQNDNPQGKPFAPRNFGIKNASGRYIAFLDCDDKWLPTKLENQIKLFEDSKCAIAFSYYKKMNEESVVRDGIVRSSMKVAYKQLLNGNCIGNLTAVYDTKKVGKVFQKDIHHEDYVMWLEILNKGFYALNTNSVEAIYRESSTSTSGNKISSFIWTWNIYRKELKLSLVTSIYHFCIYSAKAVAKFMK